MALKASQLEKLAAYLDALKGQRVGKIIQYSKDVFSFRLQRSGRVVLALDNQNPLVFIGGEESEKTSLSTSASAFLRKKLSGASFVSAQTVRGDRVLELGFVGSNDIFEEERFSLVIELIPTKANMALLDENRKALYVFRPNSITDARPLFRGVTYEPPLKKEDFTQEDLPLDVEEYFASCHDVEARLENARKTNVYQDFFRAERAKIRSLKRKIAQIEEDIEKGKRHQNDNEYGDYIFTFQSDFHTGMDHFDYEGKRIPLDPLKSPVENANDFYKKAKKAKNAIALGEENKARAEEELKTAMAMLDFASSCDEETLARLVGDGDKHAKGGAKKPIKKPKGPLPFIAKTEGFCVFFGRNSKQNDYLSFLYATKNGYFFFHVKDQVGAHVILPVEHPSDAQIQFSCEVALLATNKNDGEVQYTEHKNIRRGSVPGQVILGSYRSAYIKEISPEARRSYERAISEGV